MNLKNIYLLGDIGMLNENVYQLVEQISKIEKDGNILVLLGDNFYPSGVISKDDIKWLQFKKIFSKVKMPIYGVLGNHDYLLNPKAQIGNNLMIMNDFYYKKSFNNVNLYFLDTILLDMGFHCGVNANKIQEVHKENFMKLKKKQIDWLEKEFKNDKDKRKIVIGHYPIISNGIYKFALMPVYCSLITLFKKYNVETYLSGHEHNIQFIGRRITKDYNLNQVIIGSSSYRRPLCMRMVPNNDMIDCSNIFYGKYSVTNRNIEYINISGDVKHRYNITNK